MHLPGKVRVSRTLRRLRSRWRPGIAILGYHRVSEGTPDPLGLSVTPAHFEAQLAAVSRLGEPIRLADAAASIAARRMPRRAIVVTFDDGYADNLHTVLPLLERQGIPATIFVTSGNRGGEFWWDRLARASAAGKVADGSAGELAAEFEKLPESERDKRLRVIEDGGAIAERPSHRTLTVEELQVLAANPLIDIGAHGVSHQRLPALPLARQREEVRQCREQLETQISRAVRSFAYPHGALTEETIAIVREAGYTSACCSRFDVAAATAPLHALPRLWVGDHDGHRFERWLRGWLHAN